MCDGYEVKQKKKRGKFRTKPDIRLMSFSKWTGYVCPQIQLGYNVDLKIFARHQTIKVLYHKILKISSSLLLNRPSKYKALGAYVWKLSSNIKQNKAKMVQ